MELTKELNEAELRECEIDWPKTKDELLAIIDTLLERDHDYGTCVYAMSLSALAAFHYAASKVGSSGFQASCADMDFLRHTRNMKSGFQILDYDNLMYPQYANRFDTSFMGLIRDNAKTLKPIAEKRLKESPDAHPEVIAHWKMIAAIELEVPAATEEP